MVALLLRGTVGQNDALDDGAELVGVVGLLHQRELVGRDAHAAQAVVVERVDAPRHPGRAVGIGAVLLDGVDQRDELDRALWRDVVFDEEQRSLVVGPTRHHPTAAPARDAPLACGAVPRKADAGRTVSPLRLSQRPPIRCRVELRSALDAPEMTAVPTAEAG